jgi:hypothetical protein
LAGPAESAYRLYFRNGTTIDVESYVERGDSISYQRFGGTITVPKTTLARIEDLNPPKSSTPKPSASPDISFIVPPIPKTDVSAPAKIQNPSEKPASFPYEVLDRKVNRFLSAIRITLRVQCLRDPTESDLRGIGEDLIRQETSRQDINALEIFYFKPDTETLGTYTAGKAMWAPNGSWAQAADTRPGDYSKHTHVVTFGSAMAGVKYRTASEVPEATRRKVFYDLIASEDELERRHLEGPDAMKAAHDAVGRKYGLDRDTISKIWGEGLARDWPMPPR